jgi:hypothetical protein
MQRNKYLILKLHEVFIVLFRKEAMRNSDEEYQKLTALIKAAVTDRYVYSLDANPITYYVREYRPSSKFTYY